MSKQIQDYLQTQALSLSYEDVAVARATTQTVLANGQAHIERAILLHDRLPENFSNQIHILKQLFIALDSVYSRQPIQTATLYAWLPETENLLRLAQVGMVIEDEIAVNSDSVWYYLAARTVQSGWANIAENVEKWQQIGELRGNHNQRAHSQTSLPICGEDGVVYGVLHLESVAPLSDDELANWVGFTLGVLPMLAELVPRSNSDEFGVE